MENLWFLRLGQQLLGCGSVCYPMIPIRPHGNVVASSMACRHQLQRVGSYTTSGGEVERPTKNAAEAKKKNPAALPVQPRSRATAPVGLDSVMSDDGFHLTGQWLSLKTQGRHPRLPKPQCQARGRFSQTTNATQTQRESQDR